jgi:predicted unusual protein kinase regulating ubiquinone biosynthesis (AarF/ABC1/UbiB family)
MGWMAGGFAVGGLADGAKRLVGAQKIDPTSVFLSAARAQKLAAQLSQMRGAAMKLGQMLSLEGDDLLPAEFSDAMAMLRAGADTMPASQVRRALGRAYGKGWQELFREFDFEPLAAASIGQVHEAVAADGRELAIKIQYPGVAKSIDSDLNNLAALLRMARILPVEVDISEILAEAKRQLRQEADYRLEADNLERFRSLVADQPDMFVPRVYHDLTTKRVLAMEKAPGRPIDDLRSPEYPQHIRNAVGERLQRLLLRELFEFRFMQTDPNFANYLFQPESGRLVLLDFGSVREFPEELVDKYRQLCRAVIDEDRDALRQTAIDIGYMSGEESEETSAALTDLAMLGAEPLLHEGPYDFGTCGLAARARDAGFDLVIRQGFLRAPPPETIFLHRKVAGTFMLCVHIRAHVDTRSLVMESLSPRDPT